MVEKIYLLGMPNAEKTRIILKMLSENPIWKMRKFIFITLDDPEGIAYKKATELGMKVIKLNKFDNYDQLYKDIGIHMNILVAIGWSYKIPAQILSLFKYALNCHGSILPDYRGNNTYMHAYACFANEYGATIHMMNEKFDDGNIIAQAKLKLFNQETPLILHRRISEITALLIPEAILLVENGYLGSKQNGTCRYFYKITKDEMVALRKLNEKNLLEGKPIIYPKYKTILL